MSFSVWPVPGLEQQQVCLLSSSFRWPQRWRQRAARNMVTLGPDHDHSPAVWLSQVAFPLFASVFWLPRGFPALLLSLIKTCVDVFFYTNVEAPTQRSAGRCSWKDFAGIFHCLLPSLALGKLLVFFFFLPCCICHLPDWKQELRL